MAARESRQAHRIELPLEHAVLEDLAELRLVVILHRRMHHALRERNGARDRLEAADHRRPRCVVELGTEVLAHADNVICRRFRQQGLQGRVARGRRLLGARSPLRQRQHIDGAAELVAHGRVSRFKHRTQLG